jgi:ribulose-5-phosphate 4-epimerase/fuculose-1-phosphate aldolase
MTMSFAIAGRGDDPRLIEFREALRKEWVSRGYPEDTAVDPAAEIVFNFIDPTRPRPVRRRQRSTYVAIVSVIDASPDDVLTYEYPFMVRSLANLGVVVVPGDTCHFVTPERGHYMVDDPGDLDEWVRRIVDRITPLATSRLVIDNRFDEDLEPELWDGDELTEGLLDAGRRLDALGLLPAPFPLEELVGEKELLRIKRIYGIGGLSYGNLSTRKDDSRFWMSASGVDKSNLRVVGKDILMVKDYEEATGTMVLSVPAGFEDPNRVSVDAIEHWMIYREHPEVNAIVHVHAWIPGIRATEFNYPCGTAELATAVADIIRTEPDPAHSVVGLKNHGITVTGTSLEDIFQRIEPVIEVQVPMIA